MSLISVRVFCTTKGEIVIYATYVVADEDFSEAELEAFIEEFEESEKAKVRDVLNQLNETGVLSERAYVQLHSEIESINILKYPFSESHLYQLAANQMALEEALEPDLVRPQIDSLLEAGIISNQGYTSLVQDLKASKLQFPIEFLNYIDQALMFDLRDYSLDPEDYFPEIHQSIAQMLIQTGILEADLGEFGVEIVLRYELPAASQAALENEVEETLKFYSAVVSVRANRHDYSQASFYSPPDREEDFFGRIDDDFLNLFNKILRDQQSAYRLYSIGNSLDTSLDNSLFGVIALTEAQADVYFGNLYGDWYEIEHETIFTSDRIEEILTLFKNIGLLDHLNEAEIAEGRTHIARDYITHTHQLLAAFKDVALFFDWESAEGGNPYQYFTQDLAKISHGAFNPTDIDDGFDWENQSASLAFTLNGTRYNTDLEFNSDWLDPKFFEFIEEVTIADRVIAAKSSRSSAQNIEQVSTILYIFGCLKSYSNRIGTIWQHD